jgi:hypothetical protein
MIAEDDPGTPAGERGAAPLTSSALTLARCVAISSAVAAVIHFAVANDHYQEYWAFGAFMVVSGIAQLAWAAVVLLEGRRWLWLVGAVLNGGIVAVYIVTRTYGDVVGPTPREVEPIGFGDAFCTGLEVLIVLGCGWLLFAQPVRELRPRPARLAVGATGAVMAVLLVVALLDGGPEMSMEADAGTVQPASHATAGMSMTMATPAPAARTVALHLTTQSPAGAITMPSPTMQMAAGMKMASGPCTSTPTSAQQQATVGLVNRSWKDAKKYRSLAAAIAAGYRPITPTGLPVVHYLNGAYYQKTLLGRPVIDPAQPQSLVYANTPKGAVLVASMFIMASESIPPPQPGGCLTQWHIHTNLCFGQFATVVGLKRGDASCPAGSVNRVTPPMLHVWYVPIPGGPTAVDAPNAQIVRAAEHVRSPRNATA